MLFMHLLKLLTGAIALHEVAGSALDVFRDLGYFVHRQPRRPARGRLLWGSGEEIDAETCRLRLAHFGVGQAILLSQF